MPNDTLSGHFRHTSDMFLQHTHNKGNDTAFISIQNEKGLESANIAGNAPLEKQRK